MDNIMAIRVDHRSEKAPDVQSILTKHGCIIKLRVGCHETNAASSSEDGIILLHLNAQKEEEIDSLEQELVALDKITVKRLNI